MDASCICGCFHRAGVNALSGKDGPTPWWCSWIKEQCLSEMTSASFCPCTWSEGFCSTIPSRCVDDLWAWACSLSPYESCDTGTAQQVACTAVSIIGNRDCPRLVPLSKGVLECQWPCFGLACVYDPLKAAGACSVCLQVLDQDGVGELIKIAVERGRAARPDLKIGICGEQVSVTGK
eukprot:1139950-Pelagomonas_calceolata.AAC.1